jgi:type II secretory pathway component GspD/PulD (secretin)
LTTLALLWGPSLSGSEEKKGLPAAAQKAIRHAGSPITKIYNVAPGTAEAVARQLQELFRKSPTVRISAAGASRIVVYANPEDHAAIVPHVPTAQPTAQARTIEVIPLTALESARTVELLRGLFGAGPGAAAIVADTVRNAVLVRGSREQIDEIKSALRALGEQPAPAGGVRIITVERGDAAALAESLQGLLEKMRPNPVRVIVPGSKPAAGTKPPGAGKTDKTPPPITLTALGNKLIVTCDDPQVLALVQDLARAITAPQEGGMEVIRLRHANAIEAARILDEVFNGRPGAGTGARRIERVRIVAEPITNALLIRAAPLDMQTIRRLLTTTVDAEPDRGEAVQRMYFLGPLRHASAGEVAKVLRQLYPAGEKSVITIAVDPRTNSLILRCSLPVYEEVRKLVERLDVKVEKKESGERREK